ncbi:FadR/GntR family transcriptional regulator [Altererythrobacter lutimaris]|uniref:FadR family transcriptional regulator n=1 Tax=Altererythrobacter lutimaris TaxID=2743979 RepID=A0A850HCS5_9SPHN|nr:GntR family transcriptional regulator [Altererythrobacter lutimaris]NVE95549.1 FadR family transcriptional regulator [Altererythrobacter lutimaris]
MRRKRLFETVAEKISGLIDEGVYASGTRWPSERELAEKLGVSRVSVREAAVALHAIGRLETKVGLGA